MTTPAPWHGPDALRPLLVPIDQLTPHPDNARNGDLDAITESLEAHGQYAPVVVQKSTGRVIKGNHVYASAMGLGWDVIAATVWDVDDEQALRVLLVDNRASDLGQYDPQALADLLTDLGGDFTGSGFTDRDLDALLAQIERDSKTKIEVEPESRGLGGGPVVSYTLVFDTPTDQAVWYAWLKWLRHNVEGDTIGERIVTQIRTMLPDEDLPEPDDG